MHIIFPIGPHIPKAKRQELVPLNSVSVILVFHGFPIVHPIGSIKIVKVTDDRGNIYLDDNIPKKPCQFLFKQNVGTVLNGIIPQLTAWLISDSPIIEELICGEPIMPKDPQKSFHPIRYFCPPDLMEVGGGWSCHWDGTVEQYVYMQKHMRNYHPLSNSTLLCLTYFLL